MYRMNSLSKECRQVDVPLSVRNNISRARRMGVDMIIFAIRGSTEVIHYRLKMNFEQVNDGVVKVKTCLLYTSRCV